MQQQVQKASTSLIARMAERFGVDGNKLFETLKTTCFRQRDGSAPSNEQMMSLLVVADQYGLNPFTKEIVAFSGKSGQIVPVVSVDGWSRIINTHPQMDGVEFTYSDNLATLPSAQICPEWIEAVIYRKDRIRPARIREYLDEAYQPMRKYPGPWQTHTKRMLRHKALIQASRLAFGFTGIFEADEAGNIIEGQAVAAQAAAPTAKQIPAQSQPALSFEDLDRNVDSLRMRANQIGVDAVEAYIRDRFNGADQEYLLAAIRNQPEPEPVAVQGKEEVVDAVIVDDEPSMPEHLAEAEAQWDDEMFY